MLSHCLLHQMKTPFSAVHSPLLRAHSLCVLGSLAGNKAKLARPLPLAVAGMHPPKIHLLEWNPHIHTRLVFEGGTLRRSLRLDGTGAGEMALAGELGSIPSSHPAAHNNQ